MINLFGLIKGLLIQDATDRSKQLILQISPSATTGTTTTIVAAQTANRTITLPDGGSFVTPSSTDTFTNKTMDGDDNTFSNIPIEALKPVIADALKVLSRDASGNVVSTTIPGLTSVFNDSAFRIQNTTDNTKQIEFNAASIGSGNTAIITVPDGTYELVGNTNIGILENKAINLSTINNSNTISIDDNNLTILDNVDNSKTMNFDVSAVASSTSITLTTPGTSTTLVGTNVTQTLSNKTIADALTFTQISTPPNPPASHNEFYVKSDGLFYKLNSAGVETPIVPITSSPTVTLLTTSSVSPYNPPANCKGLKVTCIGAGGGSGGLQGSASAAAASGGGGGGGTAVAYVTSIIASYVFSIGAGGGGGTAGINTGSSGGNTSFGSTIAVANGGSGGAGSSSGTVFQAVAGGTGASGSNGAYTLNGGNGGLGITYSATAAIGGNGGSSSVAPASVGQLNGLGVGRYPYGCGAPGRAASNNGGALAGTVGQDGCIFIEEYY